MGIRALSVQMHMFATCNKLYDKTCSSKHCS